METWQQLKWIVEAENRSKTPQEGYGIGLGVGTGLNSDTQIHDHPEPMNITLFGNKAFADVIKLRWVYAGLGWAPVQYDWCHERKAVWTQSHPGRTPHGNGREMGVM